MKKILIYILIILILLASAYFFVIRKNNDTDIATSTDASNEITTQAAWMAGSYDSNIDLVSNPGSMKVNLANFDFSKVDLSSAVTSASIHESCSDTPIGGAEVPGCWISTGGSSVAIWGFSHEDPLVQWWKIDFGSTVENIAKITLVNSGDAAIDWNIYYSEDDIDYSSAGFTAGAGTADFLQSPNFDARYIKVVVEIHDNGYEEAYFDSISFYTGYAVNHTTAPTQIDGQEGSADKEVIEWTSFTPTQTTPANTSIEYEFRTSADGSDWTAWTAPQEYSGSPLDLTTLTPNRYLQVRSTLATSDALSTPRIDDYTINFHNNQKPNKPTAQTAIISD